MKVNTPYLHPSRSSFGPFTSEQLRKYRSEGFVSFQGPHSYGVLTFIESGVCGSVGLSASHPLLMGCEKSRDKSPDY